MNLYKHMVLLHNALAIWKIFDPLRYADLSNLNTFHYTVSKKIAFVSITRGLIRKILKYWETIHLTVYQFSKILIFALKAMILSLEKNNV